MPALGHPTPADLQAFAIGALPEVQARAVESHLAECPTCLAVAVAAPDDTLVTLLRSAETSQAGPVTPGPAYAETIGLAQSGPPVESVPGPPEFANHSRYRLIRPLGRGGMGHVWLAEHTLMGRTVALKIIRPEFLDKPDAVERFRREVRAAARLKHPNIVAAHDADQAGGLHFLVMEYIDGETLADRIAAGPVPVEDACRWVIDAARGLEHARENGLIHRDVKPHNLILERPGGRVKVLDFGLAGVATGESTGLTGGNVVIGTPDYIAPEQAEDARTADTRSDVYSLGCTLYHLLAGRPLFPGDAVLKKLDAHRLTTPQPLMAIRQDITPALAELVARMLAKDPSQRPQTPGEVAVALEDILAGRGGGPPAPVRPWWGGGGRWRRRWRPVAVGALVLLGALGAVLYKLTDEADISVSNEAPDQVKWVIKKDGYIVSEPSSALLTSFFLPAGGEYTVELDRPDEFIAHPKSFALRRGEKLTIRVVRDPSWRPAAYVLTPRPDGPWQQVLQMVDPARDAESGLIQKVIHDGEPALEMKDTGRSARVALPFRPDGDYEVRARVVRVAGNDSFNLMLPLPATGGRTQVGVYVDGFPEKGGYSGLDWPNGPAFPMAKTFLGRLATGRAYTVQARVRWAAGQVEIQVEVDGKPVVDWNGPPTAAQSGINFFTHDRRYLGIGACAGTFRVESVGVRMLGGTGELAPPPTAPKSPDAPRELAGSLDAPWVNMLDGLSLPRAILDGSWGWSGEVQKVSLLADDPKGKGGRFALPVWPKGDYELRLRFARTGPEGHLVVMLPVPGGPQLALSVGEFGPREVPAAGEIAAAVLEVVPGEHSVIPLKDTLGHELANGTTYTLLTRLAVKDGRVAVRTEIDGKKLVDSAWAVPKAPPSQTWFTPDRGQLGLGVGGNGKFRFEAVEFRPLSGTAEWKPGKAAAPPKKPG